PRSIALQVRQIALRELQLFDLVALDLVVQGALADAEQLGGAPAVAVDRGQGPGDGVALELGQRADAVVGGAGARLEPQVVRPDGGPGGQDGGPLEGVGELPDVAGPVPGGQLALDLLAQLQPAAAQVAGDAGQEGARDR